MSENSTQAMVCVLHPQRETLLRCNRCERPMCIDCLVLTPTGYRCKECVRGQQKIFDTAQWWDFPLVVVVSGALAYFGGILANVFGFFTIFLAPVAGVIIAEAVRRILHKRRARLIPILASGAALVGGLISPLINVIIISLFPSQLGLGSIFRLLWPTIFALLAASTIFYRLKGIRV
ncbi:MAG: hypothetical protein NTZ74_15800 [Chloroflexi bacterium]|nr:hypothetical protein [Chloroflexota bacterium]